MVALISPDSIFCVAVERDMPSLRDPVVELLGSRVRRAEVSTGAA